MNIIITTTITIAITIIAVIIIIIIIIIIIDLSGSWFSSEKQLICWNVPMIRLIAANWARLSEISSSYKEKAWIIVMTLLVKENVGEL